MDVVVRGEADLDPRPLRWSREAHCFFVAPQHRTASMLALWSREAVERACQEGGSSSGARGARQCHLLLVLRVPSGTPATTGTASKD